MKQIDYVTLHYRLDKGHVQSIGAIAQECSQYIMWHGNFDPTRVVYETIRQKQQQTEATVIRRHCTEINVTNKCDTT